MASSSTWLSRFVSALGEPQAVDAVSGSAWRVEADGRSLFVKVGEGVADEGEGLRRLASVPEGPPAPEVVLAEEGLLVTLWVEQAPRRPAHEEALGGALAALHAAPWPTWGGGSSWIGACRVDPADEPSAAGFYGERLRSLAARCGLSEPVERVVSRLEELLPPGGPALVHGDLWWGNVLWGSDGRGWVIDPSVHGGHPEEDLAMLGLFGAVPARLLDAYAEGRPLADGWRDRVELFQLYPLLVHAVLFGDSYRSQARSIAERYG